ncbi:MAG: hypothetical protein AAB948_03745 [Patescibacteria group bacterium]
MVDETGLISLENRGAGQRLAQLTMESPSAEIKSAFIAWNREVLMPMFDDIIRALEIAYKPYGKMKIIPDEATHNAKVYIFGAIETLKVHRAVYCEMADSIAGATTLGQFLTLMMTIEQDIPHGSWFPVSCGMGDARTKISYGADLMPVIAFRIQEAMRLREGCFDTSYHDVLRGQWKEYSKQASVKSLDNIGTNKKENVKILYGYFNAVLHPLICAIFAMDKREKSNWCNVFEDVPPHRENVPDFESLLTGLIRWRSRVETYLGSLPKRALRNPDYEAAKQELFKYIGILEPHLVRLQTAKRGKEVG